MPNPKKPITPIELPEYPIWERQPGDTTQWFAVLERYRLAGARRSKLGIYRAFQAEKSMGLDGEKARKGTKRNDQKKSNCLPASWHEAFKIYRFDERCAAWDAWQQEEERLLWVQRCKEFQDEAWTKRTELLERIAVMLKVPLIEKQVIAPSENGMPQVVNFKPVGWRYSDMLAMIKLSTELGALAIGEVNMAKATIERYGGRVVFDDDTPVEAQMIEALNENYLT